MSKIILASGSPRRKKLLGKLQIPFDVEVSGYKEDNNLKLNPLELAEALSAGKAEAVAERHKGEEAIIIGADTFIVLDNKILGKPHTSEKAKEMIKKMSGRAHSVITGFTIIDAKSGRKISKAVKSNVYFRRLTDEEIDTYIKTGEPIGSELLVDTYHLSVSSATVRNEMLALDTLGYLEKLHTSSGRVPTEKAYSYYVAEYAKNPVLNARYKERLSQLVPTSKYPSSREIVKDVSRNIADIAHEFILTAFADNDFYYTGLSHLFTKPEYGEAESIKNLSEIIDAFDATLKELYRTIPEETHTFIGSKNPIDKSSSLITVRIGANGPILALLGPMRMRYDVNIALLEYCQSLLAD